VPQPVAADTLQVSIFPAGSIVMSIACSIYYNVCCTVGCTSWNGSSVVP
jgi:hypothetical protein